MSTPAVYLDASAVVKLLKREAESMVLAHDFARWSAVIASDVLVVEVGRIVRRLGGDAPAAWRAARRRIALVPVSSAIRDAAVEIDPVVLRPLDAIHVATAAALGPRLDVLVAYDRRLLDAAAALGLRTDSPGA